MIYSYPPDRERARERENASDLMMAEDDREMKAENSWGSDEPGVLK